jgi:hypothetical protein
MLKMGVPQQAVVLKMRAEGVSVPASMSAEGPPQKVEGSHAKRKRSLLKWRPIDKRVRRESIWHMMTHARGDGAHGSGSESDRLSTPNGSSPPGSLNANGRSQRRRLDSLRQQGQDEAEAPPLSNVSTDGSDLADVLHRSIDMDFHDFDLVWKDENANIKIGSPPKPKHAKSTNRVVRSNSKQILNVIDPKRAMVRPLTRVLAIVVV